MGQKGGAQAITGLREWGQQRLEGAREGQPAAVIAWDEMWTYRGVRCGERREDCWIWTAVVAEKDGSRWVDFEVGDRSEGPLLRLYERRRRRSGIAATAMWCTAGCRWTGMKWGSMGR